MKCALMHCHRSVFFWEELDEFKGWGRTCEMKWDSTGLQSGAERKFCAVLREKSHPGWRGLSTGLDCGP